MGASTAVYAQGNSQNAPGRENPPGNSGNAPGHNKPTNAPFDGGIIVLVAAGAAYAIKRRYFLNNQSMQSSNN